MYDKLIYFGRWVAPGIACVKACNNRPNSIQPTSVQSRQGIFQGKKYIPHESHLVGSWFLQESLWILKDQWSKILTKNPETWGSLEQNRNLRCSKSSTKKGFCGRDNASLLVSNKLHILMQKWSPVELPLTSEKPEHLTGFGGKWISNFRFEVQRCGWMAYDVNKMHLTTWWDSVVNYGVFEASQLVCFFCSSVVKKKNTSSSYLRDLDWR